MTEGRGSSYTPSSFYPDAARLAGRREAFSISSVLLIQPEYPPSVGGMQTHASAMARVLHERGHRIAVATYREGDDQGAAAAYDARQPFPTFRCLSRIGYWASFRTLLVQIDRFQPDLIYCSTPFFGNLRKVTGLPVVCRSVGNDVMRCWIPYPFRLGSDFLASPQIERNLVSLYHHLHAPGWLERFFYHARQRLVTEAARSASAIVANSEFTRERLIEVGVLPEAVAVVAGGVDSARFEHLIRPVTGGAGIPSRPPRLLTVCRLVAKKGVDLLIEAVALARRSLPCVELVIVGDGPERSRCERIALDHGVANAVHFAGRVPHDEVVSHYHRADLFVLASRVHQKGRGWDVETMGRVICEANAAGLPVIATRTGGVPSLIDEGKNGLLVPPDDPNALASAITCLWQDAGTRQRLGHGGLVRARQEFDWGAVVTRFEAEFARALAHPDMPGNGKDALSPRLLQPLSPRRP